MPDAMNAQRTHPPGARPPPLQRPVPMHPSGSTAVPGRPIRPGAAARPARPMAPPAARKPGTMGVRPGVRAVRPPAPQVYQRIQSPSPYQHDPSVPYTPPPYRASPAQHTPVQPTWDVQHDAYGQETPRSWDGYPQAKDFSGFGASDMMNDATAQMGMQFGRHVAQVGGEYMQRNFRALLPMPILKYYFNVSNSYVLHKLRILLYPWQHKPWSRRLRYSTPYGGTGIMSPGQGSSAIYAGTSTPDRPSSVESDRRMSASEPVSYCPPREDVNSPDMYIPLMAFVTYVIATSFIYGLRGRFHPEVLGYTASRALAIMLIEFSIVKLGCYLLNIQGDHTIFDLLAYSGYKFVGTLVVLAVGCLHVGRWLYWLTFLYMFAANAFFFLRSLRYVVLPDPASPSSVTVTQGQRAARIQFLFGIAMSQILFGWLLIVGIN